MEMTYAWLVVNGFIQSEKFMQIFAWLVRAAEKQGCYLEMKTNTELLPSLVMQEKMTLPAQRPDFVLFWDKDVRLAMLLEKNGFRLFNSAKSIEICDDKARTYLELLGCGIRMPETVIGPKTFLEQGYPDLDFVSGIEERLGYPMVVKECYGSFGQQVYLVKNRDEMSAVLKEIKNRPCLFQKYIAASRGHDIRIQMAGNQPVAAMHRYNEHDFRANITNGGSMEPYEPDEAQIQMAQKAVNKLGLDFAGVDILFGEDGEPVLCEVNSNAHFVNIWKCTGVDAGEAILKHCLNAVRESSS